ncbi:hypothetical protein [Bradyrhizobium sp.]|uniref:hypothetical protein n=1 Tax=Bradyrhizobium sp. TaxID=376 RepID=UPI001D67243B|nr:hypothetical protein [Bradyrhizobium sp.]MBI5319218.1 hypothetical protein [Bradyrhizobium sp.]
MIAIVLVAIASGAASALMFASIISGALISLVLFNLAPLPLMVAAIGWGPLTAAIGGVAAATVFGLLFGMPFAIAYATTAAVPAWWLGHLALLGRPVPTAASEGNGATPPANTMEWYPSGRLLLWIAVIAAVLAFVTLLTIGTDSEAIAAAMKRAFGRMVRLFALRGVTIDEGVIDAMAAIAPAGIPSGPIIILTINLWLAGKIAVTSGRLNRPWPDLKATALPPMTLVALCVAIAFCFTGGLLAVLAKVVAGALLTAYALTGLAVLHTLTLASSNRTIWLVFSYAVMIVLFWPVLAMTVLGLADAVFGFRERFMRTRPPPLPAA